MYNSGIKTLNAGAPDIRLSGNQQMASYGFDEAMAESRQAYDDALKRGVIPIDMEFEDFLDMMREGGFLEGRRPQQNQRMASMEAGQEGTLEDIYADLIAQGFSPREAAKKAKELYNNMQQDMAQGGRAGIMAASPTGTYTQRRRTQMAGGGIMGSNAGSMLVAPTADGSRPGYFGLDDLVKPFKKVYNKVVDDIIPNELKNPAGAIAAATAANYLPVMLPGGSDQTVLQKILGTDTNALDYIKSVMGGTPSVEDTAAMEDIGIGGKDGVYGSQVPMTQSDVAAAVQKLSQSPGFKFTDPSTWLGGITGAAGKVFGTGDDQYGKYTIPMAIGAAAGKMQQDYLDKQPAFPMDETGINFQTARQAMDDPNLRFKPKAQYADMAEGGRIGYQEGGIPNIPEEFLEDLQKKDLYKFLDKYRRFQEDYKRRKDLAPTQEAASGGRIGAQEGGLMNLGGMEKDYRNDGGFVPIGGKEKADDVPARLSRNEFVFTADAVRGAGGGDIDKGAEIMENMMKHLEAGGEVSEDSQGLEGARGMFANAQQLEKRII